MLLPVDRCWEGGRSEDKGREERRKGRMGGKMEERGRLEKKNRERRGRGKRGEKERDQGGRKRRKL